MTEENYKYRTSPFLLRNQFDGGGKFEIPMIPKAEFTDDAFRNLLLIGFDRTNLENNNHLDRMSVGVMKTPSILHFREYLKAVRLQYPPIWCRSITTIPTRKIFSERLSRDATAN